MTGNNYVWHGDSSCQQMFFLSSVISNLYGVLASVEYAQKMDQKSKEIASYSIPCDQLLCTSRFTNAPRRLHKHFGSPHFQVTPTSAKTGGIVLQAMSQFCAGPYFKWCK